MNPYWLIVAFTVVTQFAVFLKWLHRRMRDEELLRDFVREMADNHLPYVYHVLRQIALHLHVDIPEPPPVRFLEFDPMEKSTGRRRERPVRWPL